MSSGRPILLDPNSTRSAKISDRAKARRLRNLMALFFDSAWFDARLAAMGLKRSDVAAALALGAEQISELWKDQRELSAGDVRTLSSLLGVSPADIAEHAGVSTPVPRSASTDALAHLNERLDRVERTLAEIKALVLDLRAKPP
jgi:transcriptional regulator with XRE-family HTH domain